MALETHVVQPQHFAELQKPQGCCEALPEALQHLKPETLAVLVTRRSLGWRGPDSELKTVYFVTGHLFILVFNELFDLEFIY